MKQTANGQSLIHSFTSPPAQLSVQGSTSAYSLIWHSLIVQTRHKPRVAEQGGAHRSGKHRNKKPFSVVELIWGQLLSAVTDLRSTQHGELCSDGDRAEGFLMVKQQGVHQL